MGNRRSQGSTTDNIHDKETLRTGAIIGAVGATAAAAVVLGAGAAAAGAAIGIASGAGLSAAVTGLVVGAGVGATVGAAGTATGLGFAIAGIQASSESSTFAANFGERTNELAGDVVSCFQVMRLNVRSASPSASPLQPCLAHELVMICPRESIASHSLGAVMRTSTPRRLARRRVWRCLILWGLTIRSTLKEISS